MFHKVESICIEEYKDQMAGHSQNQKTRLHEEE